MMLQIALHFMLSQSENIRNPPCRATFSYFCGIQTHGFPCKHEIHDLFSLASLHHWFHGQSRMSFFFEVGQQCFRIFCDSLICDHITEVINAVQLFCCCVQSFCYLFFQFFRHPYDTCYSAFCFHEFFGSNEMFSMSHKSRSLYSTTCHGSQF